MNLRVFDDAALADLVPLGLELRFDKRDQPPIGLGETERAIQDLGEGNEARVADDDIDGFRHDALVEVPGVGLLMNRHARVLSKLPCELVRADVDCEHLRGAALQENVGKAAGG